MGHENVEELEEFYIWLANTTDGKSVKDIVHRKLHGKQVFHQRKKLLCSKYISLESISINTCVEFVQLSMY